MRASEEGQVLKNFVELRIVDNPHMKDSSIVTFIFRNGIISLARPTTSGLALLRNAVKKDECVVITDMFGNPAFRTKLHSRSFYSFDRDSFFANSRLSEKTKDFIREIEEKIHVEADRDFTKYREIHNKW